MLLGVGRYGNWLTYEFQESVKKKMMQAASVGEKSRLDCQYNEN